MIEKVSSFGIQKFGNFENEFEDAYIPDKGIYEGREFCASVADGASEGYLSGEWAKILVKAYCDNHSRSFNDILDLACVNWKSWLENYLEKRQQENRPIEWYEEPGLVTGSFSTFLGLTIETNIISGSKEWHAMALGDSCLFQVRSDELIFKFPIEKSEDFNSWPHLVSTNPTRNHNYLDFMKSEKGEWQEGDSFFLMTDALSEWFIKQIELGYQPWLNLRNFDADTDILRNRWIDSLRKTNEIRNDDVTLIRIEIIG
jgi:hypothetical protein